MIERINNIITRNSYVFIGVFLLLVLLSVPNAIHYIEDPDSLRFAFAVKDFAPERGWPHFPLYPLYIFLVKIVYFITGKVAYSLSFIGAIAHFGIIWAMVGLSPYSKKAHALLIGLTLPVFWIMSSRYMPDLLGTAYVLAIYCIFKCDTKSKWLPVLMVSLFFVRLSYFPFLIPILWFWFREKSLSMIIVFLIMGFIGVLLLIKVVGWDILIEIGRKQTHGHFNEFGGTIQEEANILVRLQKMLLYFVDYALSGMYKVAYGLGWGFVALWLVILIKFRKNWSYGVIFWGSAFYLIWIFGFQNVVYKFRHLLPLVPLFFIGLLHVLPERKIFTFMFLGQLIYFVCVACYVSYEHQQPSAIAQISNKLKEYENVNIVSSKLLNFTLKHQGIQGDFIDVETLNKNQLEQLKSRDIICIGSFDFFKDKIPLEEIEFHHNDYVNPMWSNLKWRRYTWKE